MSLLNWFSQVWSVTKFGLLGIPQRRGSVAAALFGVAGVVAVLVGVLSIAVGFRRVMTSAAPPDSVIVLRSGADSEMVSGLDRETTRIISEAPGLYRSPQGAWASPELFVIIDLPKRSSGTDANVPMRGVEPIATNVHAIRIVEGRMFGWGKTELIAGAGAAKNFRGLNVGDRIKVGPEEWPIVGIFSADGGTAESEIWSDAAMLQAAYHRGDSFQSVYATLQTPDAFNMFESSLTNDPRLNIKAMRLADFHADQSTATTKLITSLGFLVASLMAIGAVFAALNTMYGSVSARTREIATLRALGFGRGAVVVSVMIEALALALAGGVLGAALAYFVFNGFETSTINWQSFAQLTFAFAVTPALLIQGITWATLIGLVGGLFPAFRAARLPIAVALREL
ncbi:MAG TPA: ABC transporter permease [Verrucomicrobiae bacterium]|nr:ABC transporter permease [Verrucomicrobiae bacterium]